MLSMSKLRVRRVLGAPLLAASLGLNLAVVGVASAPMVAHALDLSALTQADATAGVKAALQKGADAAISSLGKSNGFMGNPEVKIPLPETMQQARKLMKLMGKDKEFDALETGMNRAAEVAVHDAKPLLVNAIRNMSVADAKSILSGGDDSVTKFFRDKTQTDMFQKFLPIVTQYVNKLGLARQYNSLAGQASKFGLVKEADANIETYVTNRAMDGLYKVIAAEEKAIRADPVGTGSAILKKVFAR